MKEWVTLTSKVCPHGVDQRIYMTSEIIDGAVVTGMKRYWCRQCLREIDIRAAFEWMRTHDIDLS